MKCVLSAKDDIVVELIPESYKSGVNEFLKHSVAKKKREIIYQNVKAASFGPGMWDIGLKYRR